MDSFKIMVAKSDIDRNTEVITETIMPIKHEAYASFKKIQIDGRTLTEQIQDFYDRSDNIEIFLNDVYRYIEAYKCCF